MLDSDDRYGCMRIHVADRRAWLACQQYTRRALRAHAKAHGVSAAFRIKRDLAWFMAQDGLIDASGYLRDGFPT